jgi:hypothetical protein
LEIERGDGGAGLVKLDEESVCRVLFFFFFFEEGIWYGGDGDVVPGLRVDGDGDVGWL